MLTKWNRLSLYIGAGLTVLAILFPPFVINGGLHEYGFLLSGPPSVNAATAQASAMLGQQGRDMASDMIHYSIDFVRLIVELVVIWGGYLALRKTVLKPSAA